VCNLLLVLYKQMINYRIYKKIKQNIRYSAFLIFIRLYEKEIIRPKLFIFFLGQSKITYYILRILQNKTNISIK
jgi:hypothetical protein